MTDLHNWYRRLLLSYFPIFLITITVIIFLSFIMVNEASRKETAKADAISTSFIMGSLERSVNEIEYNALRDVSSSSQYASYLNDRSFSGQNEMYALVNRLRALVGDNELIESIYLYRDADRSILTTSGHTALSAFPDRAFVEQALNKPDYRGWSKVREMKNLGENEPKQVISMYKRLPLPFGSQGLLVINVSMYRIERIIDSMTNGTVSFMVIRDNTGKPVYDAHSGDGDGSPSSGGKVLTSLRSDRLGWTFESGLRAGQLYAWVSVVSYIWIVLGVLTVMLAIVYIVYITRRNYKPIQLMMSRIQSLQLSAPPAMKDELALIDSALEGLISRSQDYEKEHKENMLLQRSQLFMDIIGGRATGEELPDRLQKLAPPHMQEGRGCYCVLLVEIGDYGRFQEQYSVRDQNILKFALMNVFQEIARNDKMSSWAEWISGSRVGILIALPETEDKRPGPLLDVVDQYENWVEDNLHLTLSFGFGGTVDSLQEAHVSYHTASGALEHRLSLGRKAMLESGELPDSDLSHVFPYLGTISELVKDFRLNNDVWRARLQELFESFHKELLKDEVIRSLLQTLLQLLGREIGVMSEELQRQLAEKETMLEGAKSLDELQSQFSEHLTEIYRTYISLIETKSYKAMVSEMKSYIEEHFDDPDLSLKHLSDRFQISGKYASYLFKVEYDMKFVDFLVQLRMRRAEELLAGTEMSVQEIATAIGYANSITFGRVFKRTAGVTPGDYRKLKMKPTVYAGDA